MITKKISALLKKEYQIPLMQSKKVYRAISFLSIAAFIVTNTCYAFSGSGALRPAMVMGKLIQPSAVKFQPLGMLTDDGRLNMRRLEKLLGATATEIIRKDAGNKDITVNCIFIGSARYLSDNEGFVPLGRIGDIDYALVATKLEDAAYDYSKLWYKTLMEVIKLLSPSEDKRYEVLHRALSGAKPIVLFQDEFDFTKGMSEVLKRITGETEELSLTPDNAEKIAKRYIQLAYYLGSSKLHERLIGDFLAVDKDDKDGLVKLAQKFREDGEIQRLVDFLNSSKDEILSAAIENRLRGIPGYEWLNSSIDRTGYQRRLEEAGFSFARKEAQKEPKRVIVFDLDGTVLDTEEITLAVFIRHITRIVNGIDDINWSPNPKQVEEAQNIYKQCVAISTVPARKIFETAEGIAKDRGFSVKSVKEYIEAFDRDKRETIIAEIKKSPTKLIFPDALILLNFLKKYTDVELYLCSGAAPVYTQEACKEAGLVAIFGNNIFGSRRDESPEMPKDKKDLIRRLKTEKNLSNAEIMLIDDLKGFIVRIKEGNDAIAVAIDRGNTKLQEFIDSGADFIANSLANPEGFCKVVNIPISLQAKKAAIVSNIKGMIERDRLEYEETGHISLLLLKGGEEEGGCQAELRSETVERLKKHWLLVSCPIRKIGEAGALVKWGMSGLQYPLKIMETKPLIFTKEFIDIARGMIMNRDFTGLKAWIAEAEGLDPTDVGHKALSRALDYLSKEVQQMLLYRISSRDAAMLEFVRGENGEELPLVQAEQKARNLLNGRDPYKVDEQDFFKAIVVGATNPLHAHPGSLRYSVGERYKEGGSLRPAIERSRAEFGIEDIELLTSIMNAFHSPSSNEMPDELNQMTTQELEILERGTALLQEQRILGVFGPLETVSEEARFGM
ncbi:MAG: HAD family hydrolase [Candidatus Omnitrophica bacterium]|nr:HAD family hydrolase [Candidatus Omnitrophota bacterium]